MEVVHVAENNSSGSTGSFSRIAATKHPRRNDHTLPMPRFSLVIPTLRRADTLVHALATLTAQRFEDVEIVVQNNGNDSETRDAVRMNGDPRVRHFGTDAVVSMTDNGSAHSRTVSAISSRSSVTTTHCFLTPATSQPLRWKRDTRSFRGSPA